MRRSFQLRVRSQKQAIIGVAFDGDREFEPIAGDTVGSGKMVSVAFVDDHPLFLDGIISICSGAQDMEIIGSGHSADDAVSLVVQFAPDVMVVDLMMPGEVFSAIASIVARGSTGVIVLSSSGAVEHAVRALEVGARGYVLKGSPMEELLLAIREVHAGNTFITPHLAGRVISVLRRGDLSASSARLTRREEKVVAHLMAGRTNREIAMLLAVSEQTVKRDLAAIMQKLHARNRLEVVVTAHKLEGEGQLTVDFEGGTPSIN